MEYNELKTIFEQSYQEYHNYMANVCPDYWEHYGFIIRRKQIESIINALNDKFNFEKIIAVETGASHNPRDGIFGLFLGLVVAKAQGTMFTVDVNPEFLAKNNDIFTNTIPSLECYFSTSDSIKFLKNLSVIPNIIHLDSWDLNLKDPFPSALHGWREFEAIESKMSSGSIIIIDDNYFPNTRVEWWYPDGNMELIEIQYPIIGKGAHVYHQVVNGLTDWELIGTHYAPVWNSKIIIQKK